MFPRFCPSFVIAAAMLVVLTVGARASAVPLVVDGSLAGPAVCPGGGTAVDSACNVNAAPGQNRGCRYGGQHTFDSIDVINGGLICVAPFNGIDKQNTGNLVLKSDTTIIVDVTCKITAKGRGYQG